MADTASLKEILFRHSAEQCKVCESIPFDQIGDGLTDMYRKVVRIWKRSRQ